MSAHLDAWRRYGVVAAGGALGAWLRWQSAGHTFWVNVLGAAALGYLVGRVPVRNERTELLRLALGTGVLGGFTTFSTFAVEVARRPNLLYAVGLPVCGVAAAWLGLVVGTAAEQS